MALKLAILALWLCALCALAPPALSSRTPFAGKRGLKQVQPPGSVLTGLQSALGGTLGVVVPGSSGLGLGQLQSLMGQQGQGQAATVQQPLMPQQWQQQPQQQQEQTQQQQQPQQQQPSTGGAHSSKLSGSDPIALHNAYRAVHHAAPLVYDAQLEASARAWATKLAADCAFYHSGPGENLASGFTRWEDVMWAWYEEYKMYSYAAPGYSPAIGHFTQMVWAGSQRVGCAQSTANCWQGVVWACHYSPTGNVNAPQYFTQNVFAP